MVHRFHRAEASPLSSRLHRFYLLIPTLGCLFATVVSPMMLLGVPDEIAQEPARVENRVFWILLFSLCLVLSARFRPNSRPYLRSNLIWLALYLVLAGLSSSWAYAPDASFRRYILQICIITCVLLPIIFTRQTETVISDLFVCFALTAILNLLSLVLRPTTEFGHQGIYTSKNTLGLAAALTFIFALHEIFRAAPARRVWGGITLGISVLLLLASGSKTSLGLAVLVPIVSGFVIAGALVLRISPAGLLVYYCAVSAGVMTICSDMFDFGRDEILTFLFGDPTFTGRTTIWAFSVEMIERKPLLGWGYQSFWLALPDSPSVREAPGFVASMPHGHNGYLDTVLETGFLGLALVILLILSSILAVGRLMHYQPRRAWFALSVLLFTVLYNGMETSFVRSFDFSWLVFLVICAEVGTARGHSFGFLTPDAAPVTGAASLSR
jgi:exopolysaccharide production protein ExoQ